MVRGQWRPAHTAAPEEHVTTVVHSGHAHDEASADFTDELEALIDARGSGAATADTVVRVVRTQKAFVDRECLQFNVGFLWVLLLNDGSLRLHEYERLFATSLVVSD